jgi:tol-pal system protein YbgF
MGLLRRGDFAEAASAYESFLKRFAVSGYGDSVRFWLGNAQYGQRQYKDAIASFRAFVAATPQHPRVPEALLAIGNCQIEMKDTKSAKRTLTELVKAHPASEAAQAAKERLVGLK